MSCTGRRQVTGDRWQVCLAFFPFAVVLLAAGVAEGTSCQGHGSCRHTDTHQDRGTLTPTHRHARGRGRSSLSCQVDSARWLRPNRFLWFDYKTFILQRERINCFQQNTHGTLLAVNSCVCVANYTFIKTYCVFSVMIGCYFRISNLFVF